MDFERIALSRGRLIGVLWGLLGLSQFALATNSEGGTRVGFVAIGSLWLALAAFSLRRPDHWNGGTEVHRRDYELLAVLVGLLGLAFLVLWAIGPN